MKLKAAITQGTPESVIEAMGSKKFALLFFKCVCAETLGATRPEARPAEYYVQVPDVTVNTGGYRGVELRLTGVSRAGRTPKQFHDALDVLHEIAGDMIRQALRSASEVNRHVNIQLFTVIMLDGDVEMTPGSGVYSNVLEMTPEWITALEVPKEKGAAARSGL